MWRNSASSTRLDLAAAGLLPALFPDVEPGDGIAAIRIPGQGVSFHAGARPLVRIGDETFAAAFFAIWLDARTSVPALHDRLLGG